MKLLRLGVRCPACGAVPALRITDAERDRKLQLPPTELVATYQCQHRRCRETYAIPASAFRTAR